MTRRQLLGLGFNSRAIEHRVARRRLHTVHRGVYVVGRPELTQQGRWMAAVLSCGPEAALSDDDAGGLLGIRPVPAGPVQVSVPAGARLRRPGVIVHRRRHFEVTWVDGIPVTTVVCTLIDLAAQLPRGEVERAINEADRLGLIDPDALRGALDEAAPRPGLSTVRHILDRRTFALTDSELERRFLPLARRAGLPRPETQRELNGFKVDFYWPDLGLVVETDGLRYHRTPAQQARDHERDQAHTVAGLATLRFTHAQVAFQSGHVVATLDAVARRLRASRPPVRYPLGTFID